MANYSFLSLCLLLVVAGRTAKTEAEAPHRRLKLQLSLGPTDVIIPKVTDCWNSILESESCVQDIAKSLAMLDIHVSKACCTVLEKIGDKCVVDAFSSFPFGSFYPPTAKGVCGPAI